MPPAPELTMAGISGIEEVADAEAPEPVAAQAMEASVDASGTAVTFGIPRRVDILADNTPHKVTVLTLNMGAELDYLTVPKLVDEVYRRAEVVNDSEVTLLPGPVSLFHGGEYVGRASLPKIAPRETFETTMGIDERIKVERKLVKRETDKKFLKDKRRIQFAYEIKLENHTGDDQAVTVRDQIPLPLHEDIKVKLEKDTPAVTEKDEMNRLKWKTTLSKKDKRTIRYDFSVEYPRNMQIRGLP